MPKVALVACANGLGHTRRMVLLAHDLIRVGVEPVIFGVGASVRRYLSTLRFAESFEIIEPPLVLDRLTLSGKRGRDWLQTWRRRVNDFEEFDLVVSDNAPEFLSIRPDTILSGNFLWHQTESAVPADYRVFIRALIQKHKPKMITYGGFSQLQGDEPIREVAVKILQPGPESHSTKRSGILFACGTGGSAIDLFEEEIACLSRTLSLVQRKNVYLDSEVWRPGDSPFIRAEFNDAMFSMIGCAVVRPGFGVVSECIRYGIRMFPLFERGNLEMQHSSTKICDFGIGAVYKKGLLGIRQLLSFLGDQPARINHLEAIKKVNNQVTDSASSVIINSLEGRVPH